MTGLPPRGQAKPRSTPDRGPGQEPPKRLDLTRKLQRTLYRVAKCEPQRKFTSLYDKVTLADILKEAWRGVARNGGAEEVDEVSIAEIKQSGVAAFLSSPRSARSCALDSIGSRPCAAFTSLSLDSRAEHVRLASRSRTPIRDQGPLWCRWR